jgi:hypothetical protein
LQDDTDDDVDEEEEEDDDDDDDGGSSACSSDDWGNLKTHTSASHGPSAKQRHAAGTRKSIGGTGNRRQGGAAWAAVALHSLSGELQAVQPDVAQGPPILAAQRLLTLAARPDRVLCRDKEKQVSLSYSLIWMAHVYAVWLSC